MHFVDEELDHGAIIVQKTVPVLDTDDEHTLAARILEQEHVAYSEAINIVLAGGYEIAGRRLVTKSARKADLIVVVAVGATFGEPSAPSVSAHAERRRGSAHYDSLGHRWPQTT